MTAVTTARKQRGRPFPKGVSGNPAGRPRGKSKTTLIKEAALEAAERAGGKEGLVGYLQQQAIENPTAFLNLLGKVLSTQAEPMPRLAVIGTEPMSPAEWAAKHGAVVVDD